MHHILRMLLPAAVRATSIPFVDKGVRTDPLPSHCVTVAHTVAAVVEPLCAERTCPRDGGPGCACVDAVANEGHAGPSTALLSYSWSYTMCDVAAALEEWVSSRQRDPTQTYIWMCALCLNQLRIV